MKSAHKQRIFLAASVPLFLIVSNEATAQTKVAKPPAVPSAVRAACDTAFALRRQLQGSRSAEARGPSATRRFACRCSDVAWPCPVRSSARRQLATQRYACVTPSWLRVGQRCRRIAPTERMAPRPRFAEARCHASFEAHGMAAPPTIPVSLPKIGTGLRRSARVHYSQRPGSPDRRRRIRNFTVHYCV
jgi:hypothetical protein